jgi:hypothetical protein
LLPQAEVPPLGSLLPEKGGEARLRGMTVELPGRKHDTV